jgi:hypothetical protein
MVTDDPDLVDCFVHLPVQQEAPFQMDFQTIAEAEVQDAALLQRAQSQPLRVQQRLLAPGTRILLCHDTRWSVEDLSSQQFNPGRSEMVSFSFGPLWSFSPGRHPQDAFSSSPITIRL